MDPLIHSISSNRKNYRQDVFPISQWTITTRKGIILQSKCTCKGSSEGASKELKKAQDSDLDEFCNICRHVISLPNLHSMPDMLFNENLLRLEHSSGVGIEFNALDALKLIEETKDPLQVAVADGWQSARADFPFAKSVVRPFDWTFTTNYRGTLINVNRRKRKPAQQRSEPDSSSDSMSSMDNEEGKLVMDTTAKNKKAQQQVDSQSCLVVEETDERIDVNKLKVREEILFYDDITLYEDELADHGTAQYSVKVRVMPRSLFILARFYLRVDGVLARINDTRIYHEMGKSYLLREYTNREAKLKPLNLPVSTLINPNELINNLPLIDIKCEKLSLPRHN